MCGGSAKIPAVQRAVEHFFDKKINPKEVNLDEAIAEGAAY